jgi:hypothetical protein
MIRWLKQLFCRHYYLEWRKPYSRGIDMFWKCYRKCPKCGKVFDEGEIQNENR